MAPDPHLSQILAQLDHFADQLTLAMIERGETPTCDETTPRAPGRRLRLCARPWGHTTGPCVHLRPRVIDHLERRGIRPPFCLAASNTGHCLLTHDHTGACAPMNLAEAEQRWDHRQPRRPR